MMNLHKRKLITIDSKSIAARVGLAAVVLLSFVFVWFAVTWQLGNMLADVTQPTDANAPSVSGIAVGLAPGDPLAQWLKAAVAQDLSAKDYQGYADVIRLSPNDYRWWGQMGRAFEQADKIEEAEAAFEYANALAPNYVIPKWQTGNFYLRQGRETKAIYYLKQAAALDGVYREQVFSIVWDFYDQDSDKLESIAGTDAGVAAGLAKFYAAKGLPAKSLAAWNRLSKADRKANTEIAKLVSQALFDKGFFSTSVKFRNELGIEKGVGIGKIANGGFEDQLLLQDDVLFSWKILRIDGMRVQTNSFKKKSGKRSLEVSFSGYDKPEIFNIYQTVAVKPGASYKLSFALKTERLASGGMPLIQVINPIDGKILATSEVFPTGTNEWGTQSVEFSVPQDAEGIAVRTARQFCGERCTLTGSFWYDDFKMEEVL